MSEGGYATRQVQRWVIAAYNIASKVLSCVEVSNTPVFYGTDHSDKGSEQNQQDYQDPLEDYQDPLQDPLEDYQDPLQDPLEAVGFFLGGSCHENEVGSRLGVLVVLHSTIKLTAADVYKRATRGWQARTHPPGQRCFTTTANAFWSI
jgi:hypothetical protein